jgi:peptidoglycan/LPS O-acetylase OafA/YrhL
LFLLACLPFSNISGPFLYLGGFDGIDFASAVLLLALLAHEWSGRRFFEWKPLAKFGLVCYGFYLWHLTVLFIVRHVDHTWPDWLRVAVAFSATMAMTLLSWFLLERPLQRWVHRSAPRTEQLTSPVPVELSDDSESKTTEENRPSGDIAAHVQAGPVPRGDPQEAREPEQ